MIKANNISTDRMAHTPVIVSPASSPEAIFIEMTIPLMILSGISAMISSDKKHAASRESIDAYSTVNKLEENSTLAH